MFSKESGIFQLFVDSVTDYAIFALDTEGKILTWNKGAQLLKGYSFAEVKGKHFSIFYTQEDNLRAHPSYELGQAQINQTYEEEGWRIKKDGSRFWASVVISALRDSDGKLLGFSKVTKDLTLRKKAEDAIRESEERFRLLVSSVKDYAIITLDPEGRIKTWNIGAERIKGYQFEEIYLKHFSIFYPQIDLDQKKPEMELEIATREGSYVEESWRVRKDGTLFWASVTITAMFDEKKVLRGFAKVTRDLTERKNAEDRLRKANENLEKRVKKRTQLLSLAKDEADRAVRTRDDFLSIASHELKTPLTSLKLQNHIRKRNVVKGNFAAFEIEKLKMLFDNDEKQFNRLERLIDDMLDITLLTVGKLRLNLDTTDLAALTEEVLGQFRPQFETNGSVVTQKLDSAVVGFWDKYRIEQVLANLLTNTLKYGAGNPIEVIVTSDGVHGKIIVKDKGIGISLEDQSRIFQQFERAVKSSSISGLGLGLYISKQIVQAQGGKILVESRLGEGSIFTVVLPLNGKNSDD